MAIAQRNLLANNQLNIILERFNERKIRVLPFKGVC